MPERSRFRAALAVAVLGTAVAAAACGTRTPSPSSPESSPSGGIGVPATSIPETSQLPAGSAANDAAVVDPALLAVLPAKVAGIAIVPAAAAAGEMITDPSLATSASAIAVGLAATGSAASEDFASVAVIRLRPGVYSESFFADWRGSYDTAACAPAGGVASHRQQVIGARAVQVTLCFGGARTLHVHLDGDVLVSITSVGPRAFGDLVMAGLRG